MRTIEISNLTFEVLVNYHKQEGQEELAYLTILFTVIVGIIGFLGSTQRIQKSARILILFFYIGLHFSMVSSFLGSMKIHSALHEEIAIYVKANPGIFLNGEESPLYNELKEFHGHDIKKMAIAGYSLLIFMILSILSLGPNRIINWNRIDNILTRSKSTKNNQTGN